MAAPGSQLRPVRIAPADVAVRTGDDGSVYMQSRTPLGSYPDRLTERLEHWSQRTPDRVFLAERDATRTGWRTVTYSETLSRVRQLAQAVLDRKLSAERPVVILSGNGIDHALLGLACMHAGVLYAPVSPAYSLQARDYATLNHVLGVLRPGLLFAADGAAYERALRSVRPPDAEVVVSEPGALAATSFSQLLATSPSTDVDRARDAVGPGTVAKILFTSGSTGRPKGVINTQRMLCANQEMIRSVMAFLGDEPPVLCDWLPWNHTAGGNHNLGLVLYNGGTMYIDDGRPTPDGIGHTVRNLREIAVTAHFGVPRWYEMLLPYLRTDADLRRTFFSRLSLLFYAAAGLSQRFFDELRELAIATCGEEILWMTGFGTTETAPFALSTGRDGAFAGLLGLPAPGLELKLAAVGAKVEARGRGPSITPGYWKQDELTRAAFDEEGFYRLGDAMRFVDRADPARGLLFDGRLAEDFKLSSGTWVSVGPLRARILAAAEGCALDAVIAAPERACVTTLIFPHVHACRALAVGLEPDAPLASVLAHASVRAKFQDVLDRLARESSGSSRLVVRALLLEEPPSIDARELTDKGSINQKAVLAHRADLVEELYAPTSSARLLVTRVPSAP